MWASTLARPLHEHYHYLSKQPNIDVSASESSEMKYSLKVSPRGRVARAIGVCTPDNVLYTFHTSFYP